jgi:alpha-N-acetylglucosamine transferase
VVPVEELNSNDEVRLSLLARPELGVTFTKLNCWLLDKYSKCVFLDADVLVLKNIDDLFEREELSAARDAGWPDCFGRVRLPTIERHVPTAYALRRRTRRFVRWLARHLSRRAHVSRWMSRR